MSKAFRFGAQSWIYAKKTELENAKFIINHLQKVKSVCLLQLMTSKGIKQRNTLRTMLFLLLAAKITRVRQHNDVRVWSLHPSWIKNLKKMCTPYIKKSDLNDQIEVQHG